MSDLQTCSNEAALPSPQPNDCTAEQLAEMRYVKALDDLLAEAAEGKLVHVFADTLAWTVARIAVRCGTAATGDMLRRIGGYVGKIESRRQAQEEALQTVQEGHMPN